MGSRFVELGQIGAWNVTRMPIAPIERLSVVRVNVDQNPGIGGAQGNGCAVLGPKCLRLVEIGRRIAATPSTSAIRASAIVLSDATISTATTLPPSRPVFIASALAGVKVALGGSSRAPANTASDARPSSLAAYGL